MAETKVHHAEHTVTVDAPVEVVWRVLVDVEGYARNLERFDARLSRVLTRMRDDDLLVVTADHGNDPTTASTDHSREYVPLLVTGRRVRAGADLGTRSTFADVGQTLAEVFGVGRLAHGTSFLHQIT